MASPFVSQKMAPMHRSVATPGFSQLVRCTFLCSWIVNHEAKEETEQVSIA